MSGGKIILAGTICVAAVVVKVVHDMQVQERAEMRSGVEVSKGPQLKYCFLVPHRHIDI